ncbi:hypothetical protein [Paenibacillus agilis]|uniref:Restriction endonuclease type IV Mrr domain-containing protein n=1 Tax=Paenibacillus agilis TaxID=3020863 RepID=A0A559IY55_9BACL|nr:hypothetical protein [Paenibacillus agilis]TVX92556.1 hypothetical protein FPZ44_05490 [Paenibacillus agilis]
MYFPSLIRLREYEFDLQVIEQFDYWLSKLSGEKRKRIRPSRFAVDMGVDFNLANEIFSISTVKLKLFSINYEIYCPDCSHELAFIANSLEQIPSELRCYECEEKFEPIEHIEYIQLTFNLIHKPNPTEPKKRYNGLYDILKPIKPKKSVEFVKEVHDVEPKEPPKVSVSAKDFLSNDLGREEIDNTLFKPRWEEFDQAFERLVNSFDEGVSTEEKGKALEDISCLLLSFITFFRVDPTVHTQSNQIDVTVTLLPYLKLIELPILISMGRRVICECKNEDNNVPSLWVDKLAGGIDKIDHCKTGIIFSRKHFSGDEWKHAKASQIEYARLKKYILSISIEDFEHIKSNRTNFLYYLDDKLEDLEMRILRRERPSG